MLAICAAPSASYLGPVASHGFVQSSCAAPPYLRFRFLLFPVSSCPLSGERSLPALERAGLYLERVFSTPDSRISADRLSQESQHTHTYRSLCPTSHQSVPKIISLEISPCLRLKSDIPPVWVLQPVLTSPAPQHQGTDYIYRTTSLTSYLPTSPAACLPSCLPDYLVTYLVHTQARSYRHAATPDSAPPSPNHVGRAHRPPSAESQPRCAQGAAAAHQSPSRAVGVAQP